VDTSGIAWSDDDRMGLYFIEPGAPPRSGAVLYDRARSAASRMAPEDFNWSVLDSVRHVHLTGITPALGDSPTATIGRAMRETRSRGMSLSFDINYRARLWSAEAARKALESLIQDVDLLISPEADVRTVFGGEGEPEELAQHLGKRSRAPWIALTLGGDGALLWDRETFYRVEPFPVTPIDRVGAGDAFDAGLLWGFLQGDTPKGLQYGMAMAALKHTIPGDEFISSLAEVEALLEAGHRDIQR
jgi:2-dehydro-3-deoxygluconokinase